MSILNIRPHHLWLKLSEGYEDENGDYHNGSCEWKQLYKCDVVPSGEAQERTFSDGSVKRYSHVVYLDKNVRDFKVDEIIKLVLFSKEKEDDFSIDDETEYVIEGSHRYQHQYKLWVLGL